MLILQAYRILNSDKSMAERKAMSCSSVVGQKNFHISAKKRTFASLKKS